jgi:hypothetical protein
MGLMWRRRSSCGQLGRWQAGRRPCPAACMHPPGRSPAPCPHPPRCRPQGAVAGRPVHGLVQPDPRQRHLVYDGLGLPLRQRQRLVHQPGQAHPLRQPGGLPLGWAGLPLGCRRAGLGWAGLGWAAAGLPLGCRWAAAGLPLGCRRAAAGLPLGCRWAAAGLPLGCRWAAAGLPPGWAGLRGQQGQQGWQGRHLGAFSRCPSRAPGSPPATLTAGPPPDSAPPARPAGRPPQRLLLDARGVRGRQAELPRRGLAPQDGRLLPLRRLRALLLDRLLHQQAHQQGLHPPDDILPAGGGAGLGGGPGERRGAGGGGSGGGGGLGGCPVRLLPCCVWGHRPCCGWRGPRAGAPADCSPAPGRPSGRPPAGRAG